MAVEGIVGEAWVLVRPYTEGFTPALKKEVAAGTAAADAEAAAAGGLIGPKTIAASEKNAETAASRVAGSFNKKLTGLGAKATHGLGGALVGGLAIAETGKAVVEAATGFETAEASIASQTGQTMTQVKGLGKAFLDTARNGEVMFHAADLASSYAGVSGQLKLTTGHVLTNTQALKFMKAAENDAEASGGSLGGATNALSSTMQAFHLKIKDVNSEADLLYNISRALNIPIESVSTAVDRLHTRLGIAAPTLSDTGALMVSFGKAGVQGQRGLMVVNSAMSTLLASAKAAGPAKKASEASIMAARIAEQTATDNVTKALKTYGVQSEQYAIAVERQKLAQQKLGDIQKPVAAKLTATQQTVKDLGITVFDQQGKFVGMSKLIGELSPQLDKMTQAQRTATLQTLFGKTAAQLMGQVIRQGVPGWNNATNAVNRHGSAERGAQLQAHTLKGETRILGSQMDALAVEIGQKVIPVVTAATGWLVKHKGVAEALAAVIGGVLVLAVGRYVGKLVWGTAQTAIQIGKQIAQWTGLATKADASATQIEAANKGVAASTTTTATTVEAESAAEGTAMEGVGVAATTGAAEVAAADTAIEAESGAATVAIEAEGAAAVATEAELAGMGVAGAAAGGAGLLGAGAGAAGGAGMLGVEGLTAGSALGVGAAGFAAYQGTSLLLQHTPVGKGVASVADSVTGLLGLGPNTNPDKNLTTAGVDYHKVLDEVAKQLGETEDQAMHDKRAEALVRQKMGWSTPPPTPPGWHAPMALPDAQNGADLKRLIAEQNGGTKQVASHTNTTNALLKKQNATLERIDRTLASRTHGRVTQLPRFLAEEFRQ